MKPGEMMTIKEESQISKEFSCFDKTITQIDSEMDTLIGKIIPVLKPSDTNKLEEPKQPEELCEIAQAIRDKTYRLESIRDVISRTIERVCC